MTYSAEVFIPFTPKLPNRMGWGKLNRFYESKKWIQHVARHFIGKCPSEPLKNSTVIMIRYSSIEPDRDNNFASLKPCIDALVKNGIIINDDPKSVRLDCLWAKSGHKNKGLMIKVYEENLPVPTVEAE